MSRILALSVLLALLCSTALADNTEGASTTHAIVMTTVDATIAGGKKTCPSTEKDLKDVFDQDLVCGPTDEDKDGELLRAIKASVKKATDLLKGAMKLDGAAAPATIDVASLDTACTKFILQPSGTPATSGDVALYLGTAATTKAFYGTPCKSAGALDTAIPTVAAINIPIRAAKTSHLDGIAMKAVLAAMGIDVVCTGTASYTIKFPKQTQAAACTPSSPFTGLPTTYAGEKAVFTCPTAASICLPSDDTVNPETSTSSSSSSSSSPSSSSSSSSSKAPDAAIPKAMSSTYGFVSTMAIVLSLFAAMH